LRRTTAEKSPNLNLGVKRHSFRQVIDPLAGKRRRMQRTLGPESVDHPPASLEWMPTGGRVFVRKIDAHSCPVTGDGKIPSSQ
jgi:hypothetical protein